MGAGAVAAQGSEGGRGRGGQPPFLADQASETLGPQNLAIGDRYDADVTVDDGKRSIEQTIQPLWCNQADHRDHAASTANLAFPAPAA